MPTPVSKEKVALLEAIVRSINNVFRASSMYPPKHPMQLEAAKALNASLESWFRMESKVELGFSPNNILLGAQPIKEKDELFATVATTFHRRGLQAITLSRGVTETETATFFEAAKQTPEAIAAAGGIGKQLRGCPHIRVKEVDYSALLVDSGRNIAADPTKIWEALCRIGEDIQNGVMSGPKMDALLARIKDSGKSAEAFNTAYARAGRNQDVTAFKIWQTIGNMTLACEDQPPDKAKAARQFLSLIVAKLNPELISRLFERDSDDATIRAAQDCVLDSLPDQFVANLIASIMDKEGKIDRRLMDMFAKISTAKARTESVAAKVADKLQGAMAGGDEELARIRQAVSEAFENTPENEFISELYRRTLDNLSQRKGTSSSVPESVRALLREHEAILEPANLARERCILLLNLLWSEPNPVHFGQFSDMLVEGLRKLEKADPAMIRDALDMYCNRPMEGENAALLAQETDRGIGQLGAAAGAQILTALIPKADGPMLRGIGRALSGAGEQAADPIVEACLRERSTDARKKYGLILSGIRFSSERARKVAAALRKGGNDDAGPMIEALLKSGDPAVADSLFEEFGEGLRVGVALRTLVRLCGTCRAEQTVPHLGAVLSIQPFLDWRGYGPLRVLAAQSLAAIGSQEALRTLVQYADDKNPTVRGICQQAQLLLSQP